MTIYWHTNYHHTFIRLKCVFNDLNSQKISIFFRILFKQKLLERSICVKAVIHKRRHQVFEIFDPSPLSSFLQNKLMANPLDWWRLLWTAPKVNLSNQNKNMHCNVTITYHKNYKFVTIKWNFLWFVTWPCQMQ